MIAPDLLLYQRQIYNFLRSVTIKYEPVAEYLNLTLLKNGYAVDEYDKSSWKYYRNMIGEYHPADTKMYVTSLDTRQTIMFAPATLAKHPRTRKAYAPGGSYYNRLCETYPDQVDLIKSILFPVENITKAITADDLTLLGYGSGYLEDYEETVLVADVRRFLAILKERWYFRFLDDEPLFYLTFWSSLPVYLAELLSSARLGYIHTPYVHSFHIWSALKANGVDDYSDILDREKAMMLYENIAYLKTNAGKQSNLILLANRLLANLGVALYGRRVVQESATGAADYQLTPQLAPVRIPTDYAALATEVASASVAVIQGQVAEKNLSSATSAEQVQAIERRLGDTTLNFFMTKFLEIRPIARNKIYAEMLNMFILETLVVAVSRGYYSNDVDVTDPLTGLPIYLKPKQLLALYHYASQKSVGIAPTTIPTQVWLYRAFKTTIGTPSKTIPYRGETVYISSQVDANAYLADLNYSTIIDNPANFSDMVSRLWLRYLDHVLEDQKTSLDNRYVILHYLNRLCTGDRVETLELVPEYSDYQSWLGLRGVALYDTILSQYHDRGARSSDWGNLADAVLSALVPLTDTLRRFGDFTLSDEGFVRLRQLFVQMCSYRVVFLESERDAVETAPGLKWSNYHGPSQLKSYADSYHSLLGVYSDTLTGSTDTVRHDGFVAEQNIAVTSHGDYSVGLASATIATQAQQGNVHHCGTVLGSTTTVTQGHIDFTRTPATITTIPSP